MVVMHYDGPNGRREQTDEAHSEDEESDLPTSVPMTVGPHQDEECPDQQGHEADLGEELWCHA